MTRDPEDRRKFLVVPLTKEQKELAEEEIRHKWIYTAIKRCAPKWLVHAIGYEELNQIGMLAVCQASKTWKPFEGTEFMDYAWNAVKWEIAKRRIVYNRNVSVWREMEFVTSDTGSKESYAELEPDHRRDCHDHPTLHLWCSPDYSEQRRCLDWRSRILLYLLTVEGWTKAEVSEVLGVSRMRVMQIEDEAVRKLASFRIRRLKALKGRAV